MKGSFRRPRRPFAASEPDQVKPDRHWKPVGSRVAGSPDHALTAEPLPRGPVDLASPRMDDLLPYLRLRARELVVDDQAADRLVERTLVRAIDATSTRDTDMPLAEWLDEMLRQTAQDDGLSLMN